MFKLKEGISLFGGEGFLTKVTGNYGTVSISGNLGTSGGYAGYSITNSAVFMSNGSTAGVYNDVENEWFWSAVRNSSMTLYFNGGAQASTESGYFLGTNQLRSPIYYDSANTSYYVDAASTSNLNILNVGTINRDPTVTLSGDVTGSATMTNLGSINIVTTVANSVVHSRGNSPADLNNADMGVWRINASEANRPSSGVNYGTLISFDNSADTGFQIAASYSSNKELWFRGANAPVYGGTGSFQGWERIFHTAYHPNADKWTTARTETINLTGDVTGTGSASVDGSNNWTVSISTAVANDSHTHSNYVEKNVGYVWTGVGANALSFRSNDTIDTATGDQAALEVYQDTVGADAFMQFHVAGDYAKYFGLHGGINDFVVGGWSYGAGYQRIFHDGYHPNADKWTTARTNTVTLTGSVTGSGSASVDGSGNWTVTVPTTTNHTHNYDNYGSWTAEDGDGTQYTVTSGDILKFAEGGGIDVNFTADDVLTISHLDTSTQGSVNNSNGTVIQDVTLDGYGHVTGLASLDGDARWVNKSGDTMTGNLTVNANLYGYRYYENANGVPSNNLGNPTVTEMALFDEQFNNKTAFYTIANLKFYTSTDGATWTEYTGFSDTDKRRFLGGDGTSGVNIPNLTPYFRIELTNNGNYVYLNALYMYWSSNSHSTTVKIRKQRGDGVWSQHTNSSATVSSWPGHLYLPFSTIPFNPSTTSTGHYRTIQIDFQPNWSGHPTYGSNPISLYKMQVWGGYPAGRRNIYTIDENQNVSFPQQLASTTLSSQTFYDSNDTAYFVDPAGTSELRNLYVEAQDSGVSEFRFGENSSGSYGTRWYWDSSYTHTWYSRHAGTDSTIMYHDTRDTGYLHMGRAIHMHAKDINYLSQLHFNDNVRFYDDGNDNYLNFKWGDAAQGGIKFYDGDNTLHGYIYGDGGGRFGLLDNDGSWAVRIQTADDPLELSCNGNVEFMVYDTFTSSPGSSRAPIFYDLNNSAYYLDPSSTGLSLSSNGIVSSGTGLAGGFQNRTYTGGRNRIWSFGNADSYGISYFQGGPDYIGLHVSGVATQASSDFWVSSAGISQSSASSRAPIFYDSNDTNYYVDPGSTSQSARFRQFVQIGDSSSYSTNSGTWGARLNVTDNVHAKIDVGQDADGMLSHWYAHTGQSSIKFGTSSGHDVEFQRGNVTELALYSGHALANNQMRAPIFYDSNNTAYYGDFASTSRMNSVYANQVYLASNDSYRYRFWAGSNDYAIGMSSSGNATYGGRAPGETTSDYNMYFTMGGGTNRGFVFRNSNAATGAVAGIDSTGTGYFPQLRFGGLNPTVEYDFNASGSTTSADGLAYLKFGSGISTGVNLAAVECISPSWSAIAGIGYTDNKFRIMSARGSSDDALRRASSTSVVGEGDTTIIGNVNIDGTSTRLVAGIGISGLDVYVAGDLIGSGDITAYSDERLKENIETLDGSKVYEMRGVSFIKDGKAGSGVVAQELEKVAPELVHDSGEYKSVAYGNLVGYLIEAVKELKAEVEDLKTQLSQKEM